MSTNQIRLTATTITEEYKELQQIQQQLQRERRKKNTTPKTFEDSPIKECGLDLF
ncbi:hypothetical protein B7P43_G02812 [Cryptotermes secundus]|uniref:Uncharacterized protein n=1 Tax=Cryptotermes secundus TaxID=105785 RepID=A0A2J7RSX8_9NEOP|nr:hypothetical protein B7P43_G02812 [Cryptotermes secundus]